MIIYLERKDTFRNDILSNRIDEKIAKALKSKRGISVGASEFKSWGNSLRYMETVIADNDIPNDAGIAIEYNLPNTSKRIDFIITGKNKDNEKAVVIVELKQWTTVSETSKDAIVSTFLGGGVRETVHPSYQAWSYAALLEDFNTTVQDEPIRLYPCAYLHNCHSREAVLHQKYQHHIDRAPAFLKDDALQLRNFLKQHVKYGDSGDVMYLIRDGKIRPSKSLVDHLASLLDGNEEFRMIDDQKLVFETSIFLAEKSTPENKNVLIVEGGPGTGKSVVAVNLLVELTKRNLLAKYVTKNGAPREVYRSKLAGTMTKTRIADLFTGSGSFIETPPSSFHALITDEAHRLNELSGLYGNLGEHQIKEIISAAMFSVFFIDEAQQIHWKDIGDIDTIESCAKQFGADITRLDLKSQFRCNGSDGYLAWVDNTLNIRETANTTLHGINYECDVLDSASDLRDRIYELNESNNKARMVAGYTWKWISKKKDPTAHDIILDSGRFKARWNLAKDSGLWIMKSDSVCEVGCIHTTQGLELDYIGVIFGSDFIVRNGKIITNGAERDSNDMTMRGFKNLLCKDPVLANQKADKLIKNTYRTLMTRGQRGCFMFSPDKETNKYLKSCL